MLDMLLSQDADLRLRGGLRVRVTWPPETPDAPPLLVYVAPRTHAAARRLAVHLPAVVLSVPSTDLHAAREALEWGADHATELGAAPHRLSLVGEHGAAGLLAALARHARDRGWPPIEHTALVPRDLTPQALDALVRLLQVTGSQAFGKVGGMRPG
jgi:acetyl esterase/lipase